jgi:hypothetical protein
LRSPRAEDLRYASFIPAVDSLDGTHRCGEVSVQLGPLELWSRVACFRRTKARSRVNASLLAFASVGFVLWYVDLAYAAARGPWPSYDASEVRDHEVAFCNLGYRRYGQLLDGNGLHRICVPS